MAEFIKNFMAQGQDYTNNLPLKTWKKKEVQNDKINDLVEKTWFDYDTDRSGFLEKMECFKFL